MKLKKLLSVFLASAVIATAPASARAADFTDADVSVTEEVTTEDVAEEATLEQEAETSEDESEELEEAEDTEELSLTEDTADENSEEEVDEQDTEDPFSDGEAVLSAGEAAEGLDLKGTGTETDPYLLASSRDIKTVAEYVNSGKGTFTGQYLKFTEDITLPSAWVPVGTEQSKFQGNLDGDGHLLKIPRGEKCLLGYVANASLKNLSIYGPRIASDGVVCNYVKDTKTKNTINIDNVTLKSGTQTLKSGFIGGFASGENTVNITNCTVEKGVVIGYDRKQSNIGSFGGDFNGTVQNCVSYADVYGSQYVGGICGNKGQSMGIYELTDCSFYGTVTASGNYAGGISGGGYGGTYWGEHTAPNTPGVTIQNCYSDGIITGKNYVGGILGAETGMVQCWDNGIEYIQNNNFEGRVTASNGKYEGGIVGYINGLDKYNIIENNVYSDVGVKGIGFIRYIDTSCKNPADVSGVTYYNTEKGVPADAPDGVERTQHNRTDDPLGADAEKLVKLVAKDISVSCTILGDQIHDSDKDHKYHTRYAGNLQTWAQQSEYTILGGSTVKEVIDLALQANNMTCENPSGNYIKSVTKDGVKLEEFDNGVNSGWMYTINGVISNLGVGEQTVRKGDNIVFFYTDWYPEEDTGSHTWKSQWNYNTKAHWHECSRDISFKGFCNISSNARKNGYGAHTFKSSVTKKPTYRETGIRTYTCSVCGYKKTETIEKLKCTSHVYVWKTTTAATVFAPAKQVKVCSRCGYNTKQTRNNGTKLTPTVKLNRTKITLKTNQTSNVLKVSGLAKGDSVKQWISGNKTIVAVNSKGVLKAKNKPGTTKVYVELKSGKKAYVTVTVQRPTVKTTKITGVKTSVTLNRGKKLTLKPAVTPRNSTEKITYTSSNTKVVVVSAAGIITAKNKGTAVITVKSGTKKVTCRVTVK